MFSTSLLFGQRRVRTAGTAAVIVLVTCTFSVHAAVIDPQLTISVRAYSAFDRMHVDLDEARAQVEAAFRPTGIAIEWVDCHGQSAPAHCESPPQADEVVVRIVTATESHRGPFVPLGVSLVDSQKRAGCYATIYLDRIIALAERVDTEAGPLLGRAIAHEIGHLLLGTTRHASDGLMRKIWSPKELQRNDANDWIFLRREVAAIREAVANRLAGRALALR
jgi:hypothetical protein